jgi:hypothetical protein
MSQPHAIVTYQAVGTRRTNRWRLGAPVEVHHEGKAFPCVQQAERSARAMQRRHGGIWDVVETIQRHPGRDSYRTVATVRQDALGRVWTDVLVLPGQEALL